MTEAGAARSVARERLANHAARGLDLEYQQSQRKLRERRDLQNELKGVETALRPPDEARALQGAGTPQAIRPSPSAFTFSSIGRPRSSTTSKSTRLKCTISHPIRPSHRSCLHSVPSWQPG